MWQLYHRARECTHTEIDQYGTDFSIMLMHDVICKVPVE